MTRTRLQLAPLELIPLLRAQLPRGREAFLLRAHLVRVRVRVRVRVAVKVILLLRAHLAAQHAPLHRRARGRRLHRDRALRTGRVRRLRLRLRLRLLRPARTECGAQRGALLLRRR
eukprot:scaffold15946_cov45-Phaeocystis_antarctica.AAC.6